MNHCIKKPSPHNLEVACWIKEKRLQLKKEGQKAYSAKAMCQKMDCSMTYYRNLEAGEREIAHLIILYQFAFYLSLPLNILIQKYLGISDKEIKEHFTIQPEYYFEHDNSSLMRNARKKVGENAALNRTTKEIANGAEISSSHYERLERGERKIEDVRVLYDIAKILHLPMYVLLRNELNKTDEEMARVISYYQEGEEEIIPRKVRVTLKLELNEKETDFWKGVAKYTTDAKVLQQLALFFHHSLEDKGRWDVLNAVVNNEATNSFTLNVIAEDKDDIVRMSVAKRLDLPEKLFWKLADDSSSFVIYALLANANLPKRVFHFIVNRIVLNEFILDADKIDAETFANRVLKNSHIAESEIPLIQEWVEENRLK